MGTRTSAKDFKDQARPVDDFNTNPGFQIALLYRRQRVIDEQQADFLVGAFLL